MANKVKTILTSDNSDLDQGLKSGIGGIKKFAVAAAAIGAGVAIFAGIKKAGQEILSLGKESIALFMVQEDAEARVEAVLRSTNNAAGFTLGQLKAIATEMQGVTSFGDEDVLDSMSLLLTFANVTNDTFKQTLMTAADLSVILKTDLRSAMMQLGKALDNPIEGYRKLKDSGVSFSDQQKQMIYDFQNAGDAVSAQGVIMAAILGQVGGAAERMADTTSGKFKQLTNRIGDIKEAIGEGLVLGAFGVLEGSADSALTAIEDDLDLVTAKIQLAIENTFAFGDALAEVGRERLEQVGTAAETIVSILPFSNIWAADQEETESGVQNGGVQLSAAETRRQANNYATYNEARIARNAAEAAAQPAAIAAAQAADDLATAQLDAIASTEAWMDASDTFMEQRAEKDKQKNKQEDEQKDDKTTKKKIVDEMGSGFRSQFESGEAMFRRIQMGAASEPASPEVEAIEEVEKGIDEQVKEQRLTNIVLGEISDKLAKETPVVGE